MSSIQSVSALTLLTSLFASSLTYAYTAPHNRVENGGFESDMLDWSSLIDEVGFATSIDASASVSGSKSLRVDWSGASEAENYYHTSQEFDVIPGWTYKLSGFIKTSGITCDNCNIDSVKSWNGVRIIVEDPNYPFGQTKHYLFSTKPISETKDWTRVEKEFSVPLYSSQIRVRIRRNVGPQSGTSTGVAWWDDVQIVPVGANDAINDRNLVMDPGFNTPLSTNIHWSLSSNLPVGTTSDIGFTLNPHDPNEMDGAAKVTWDGDPLENQDYYHFKQNIPVKLGSRYRLKASVKTAGFDCINCSNPDHSAARVDLVMNNGGNNIFPATDGVYDEPEWTNVEKEFLATDTTLTLRLRRYLSNAVGLGTAWWDNIELVAIPQITDVAITGGGTTVTLTGEDFGADPEQGSYNTDQNCVLYEGACVDDADIQSWSPGTIVVDRAAFAGALNGDFTVRSGGVVSGVHYEDQLINITNGQDLTITFDGAGIDQIESAGRQFIDPLVPQAPLYELTVKNDPFAIDSKVKIKSTEATNVSRETIGDSLVITANHGGEFIVTATVSLASGDTQAEFDIAIENNGTRVIQSVRYPIIRAATQLGSTSTDDTIVLPFFEGYLIEDPLNFKDWVNNVPNKPAFGYRTMDRDYPGQMAMQMMAYYDGEGSPGLYMASTDGVGYKKKFGVDRVTIENIEAFLFSYLHVRAEGNPTNAEYGGEGFNLDYTVNLDAFDGDWQAAADIYKAWALGQSWTTTKLKDRNDVPTWLFDVDAMIDCYSCKPDVYVNLVDHYQSLLATDNLLLYPGGHWGIRDQIYNGGSHKISWSGPEYFSDYPVYDPLTEPLNPPHMSLDLAIEDLAAQNVDVVLFMEGGGEWDLYAHARTLGDDCSIYDPNNSATGLFYDDRPDYLAFGEPYTIVEENLNKLFVENFAVSANQKDITCRQTAVMCVGSDSFNNNDKIYHQAIERGIDHGARIMSLDGLVAGNIDGCWDVAHGHDLGEGRWTHNRLVSVLGDIDQIIEDRGMTGSFGVSMENANELYLQHLDLQYMRHSDFYPIGNKKVPLFNYVYKEFYIGIERGLNVVWEQDIDYLRWGLATDFVQGNVQGTMIAEWSDTGSQPVLAQEREDYYRNLIAMKRGEFYQGSMLSMPQISGAPSDKTYTETIQSKDYKLSFNPLVTNALKTDAGTISYLLVNSDETTTYNLSFDAEQHTLPGNTANVTIIQRSVDGTLQQSVQENAVLPYAINLAMAAGDVVEVRIEQPVVPDLKANGIDGPLTIQQGTNLIVTAGLEPGGYGGVQAEWWIALYYWNAALEDWAYILHGNFFTGSIAELVPEEIINSDELDPASYLILFGVDYNLNGDIDFDSALFDAVVVKVE